MRETINSAELNQFTSNNEDTNINIDCVFFFSPFIFEYLVSASFAAGPDANASRQRHAPLYGRIVPEEHLSATHRDAVHQVSRKNIKLCTPNMICWTP